MKDIIKKILIGIVSYVTPWFLFILIFYKFQFKLEYVSNTFFYIGIFSFFFGLISLTNAQNVFVGFRYFVSKFKKRKEDQERLSYAEFREDKLNNTYTYKTWVLLIVGVTFIVLSLILAGIYLK